MSSDSHYTWTTMVKTTHFFTAVKKLIKELKFCEVGSRRLICDYQVALHIASNPVFHRWSKYIDIDRHFIRGRIVFGEISTSFVDSNDQLTDLLTNALLGQMISYIYNKLDAFDFYVSTWEEVLKIEYVRNSIYSTFQVLLEFIVS